MLANVLFPLSSPVYPDSPIPRFPIELWINKDVRPQARFRLLRPKDKKGKSTPVAK